jgi:hypothetical protein
MRIEVSSLSFLPFAQRRVLPAESGIYIFCRGSQALYVGRSANIRRRVATHNRRSQLQDTDRVGYRLVEPGSLHEVERHYILMLQPSLNWTSSPAGSSPEVSCVTAVPKTPTPSFYKNLLLRAFCLNVSKSYLTNNILIEWCDRSSGGSLWPSMLRTRQVNSILIEWAEGNDLIDLLNYQMDFYANEYHLTVEELIKAVLSCDAEDFCIPDIHKRLRRQVNETQQT